MRKVLLVSLLSSAVFAAEPPVVANPPIQNNEPVKETPKEPVKEVVKEVAKETPTDAKSALKNLIGEEAFNDIQIQPSALKGLQEVILEGNIFYMSEDGRYLIRGGDILDLKEKGKNITEERRNTIRVSAMKELKEEEQIIFKPKETKYVINVFTDVDCFYCAKLHKDMSKYNDQGIEVRYIAFPRGGISSPTYKTMVSVWCADDKHQAMTDAKSGKAVPQKECTNPVSKQFEFGRKLGVSGTPALLMPNGELLPGYVPAEKLVQFLAENAKK
jgi:thiol:disulfide interchange protein DsbC